MNKLALLILPIIARFAWNTLVPILYYTFEKKYGKGLLGFIFELIADKHPRIQSGEMTKQEAEAENLAAITGVTQQSPGLFTSMAKLVHTVCYMEKIRKDDPSKFDKWVSDIVSLEKSPKIKYSVTDYMYLYKNNFLDMKNK